ncbi:two component transcriptional regulator, LuxR family [Streptomyces sp. DvalAA-14]|uniref:response regulator transcription factor n=1 Tax=unclassified Streptomyces TaxID=2593676 RepID=UPI00081B7799|nr:MULTISPECIES: response regulator transcription factor [unclassified Streptomyces]MYS23342.1 response regulator [Streptomyces sp. SID4948]SCE31906.1 two component transcriptional regulator, LuxR family [Streptomyces sp. DvalAA-14]
MTPPEPASPDGTRIRVLIADDQRVVRDGLVLLIGMLDGIEVVGAASNGSEAVELAERLRPDVVLMDLNMPVLDGVAATALLRERLPDLPVLVLTTYADDDSVFPALRAGARGYLTKDADDEQVETAIHNLHRGRTWLDPVVQARLVATIQPGGTAPAGASRPQEAGERASGPGPDDLTPREAEVLTLIAEGLSNAQICARLVVSPATVKTHINRIFAKIGVNDRAQAVRYAYRNHLTDPS